MLLVRKKASASSKRKDRKDPSEFADDGERRAEGVVADVLALDPEEPRVGWRRHLPQGVTRKETINDHFVIFSVLICGLQLLLMP